MKNETMNIAALMEDVFMSFEHKMKKKGIEPRIDMPKRQFARKNMIRKSHEKLPVLKGSI